MREINVQSETINIQALDAALRAELGEVFVGLSIGPNGVILYLTDEATLQQEQQARGIVAEHDPSQLTPSQQAEIERQQQLEQMREANAEPLDIRAYDKQAAPIRQLVARIAWLERELADLRGVRA